MSVGDEQLGGILLLYRELNNWKEPAKHAALVYLAQRLDELTFEYTLDSFIAPTTNAPFLTQECLDVIALHEKIGTPITSVHHVLDELEQRLSGNLVAKELVSIDIKSQLSFDRNNPESIAQKIKVLKKELNPYIYVLKCFEIADRIATTNEKKTAEFVAREIVTTLINIGANSQYINRAVVEHFFSAKEVVGPEVLKDLYRSIFPHHHKYTALLAIEGPYTSVPESLQKKFQIRFVKAVPKEFDVPAAKQLLETVPGKQKLAIVEGIEAIDRHAAAISAKDRIEQVGNLFKLFNHKGVNRIGDTAILQQRCCSDDLHDVSLAVNRMHFTQDNRVNIAAVKSATTIKEIRLRGESLRRFFTCINFHGIGTTSSNIDNQFVNIWTAMETVVPNRGGTIISGVASGALPAIGLQYFRRIMKSTALDLVRWDRKKLGRILGKAPNMPEDLLDRLLALLSIKENEDCLKDLLSELGNFEVMKFRLFEFNKIFSDSSKIIERLTSHQQRVSWQLHRIYRTRNAIVHSGREQSGSSSLIANAHDYFDQVMSITTQLCSGDDGFTNYEDCFNYMTDAFDQYTKRIQKIDKFTLADIDSVIWRPRAVPNRKNFFDTN